MLLAFPVGSFVAGLQDYPRLLPVPFLMTAAGMMLAAVAYGSMHEPVRTRPKEGFLQMGVQGLRTLFVHADLRAYVLNAVSISGVTFMAFWFYQPVGLRAGVALSYLGLIAAGFNLFSTLLVANSAVIERAIGLRRLLLLTAAIPAGLFALLALVTRVEVVVPALFLLVGCRMIRIPIFSDLINRHIERENRATVISAVSLLERAVTFALYPIAGALADRPLDYALLALGALCSIFAVGTGLADHRLPVSPSPSRRGSRPARSPSVFPRDR